MALKKPNPSTQKGLSKLPENVRNKMGYMSKGGVAKRKVRKFQEGGITDDNFTADQLKFLGGVDGVGGADRTDPFILYRMRQRFPDAPKSAMSESFESATGRNKNIGDDVRERAMRSVMPDDSPAGKTGYGEQNELPEPIKKTITKTSVSVGKQAPAMPAEEKARMNKLIAKQGLERVEPEAIIPGPRMIASLLKSGAKFLGRDKLREYTMDEFERMTPKLGRESLKLGRDVPRLGMKKGGAVKKMASGGKVSSASKRGDGIAIRGKTRA